VAVKMSKSIGTTGPGAGWRVNLEVGIFINNTWEEGGLAEGNRRKH